MNREDERSPERPERERRLWAALAAALQPAPMSAARRSAFQRAIDERIESRSRALRRFGVGLPLATSAAAAAALWFAVLAEPSVPAEELVALVYTADDEQPSENLSDHLPDDYWVLSTLLESDPAER